MNIKNKEENIEYLLKAIWGYGSGSWCWWNHLFPDTFQIEFNNTLLWMSSTQPGQAIDYKLAIAFFYPTSVSFLTCKKKQVVPEDWSILLNKDKLDGFYVSDRFLTFNNKKIIKKILSKSKKVDTIFGVTPKSKEFYKSPYQFAFLSEDEEVGLIVGAKDIHLMSSDDNVKLENVEELYEKWWEYFYDYKEKVGTNEAYPSDWICDSIHIVKNPNNQ